ncbi:V-set domain-containing T-cell activation inhibitor 1-like isoform X2 [Siphateles boraxobius]|uniref:V-set domain-containing T-cell activation inhibitor 1-like isoform X2 n=1 Tax=Siphateles boraxobius TaxID=180520 RepID=UPI004062BBE7
MLWFLLMFADALVVASFEVTVTDKHLLAIRGGSAVLGCEFTPDPDLSNLVVTWQRSEDSQVVHSFYYQQDQLDRQSPEFHNRTSFFISELHKGNASLRIAEVRPKDAGLYLCIVSNAKGTGKALMKVTYGVQFETEGFPEPEVIWLDEHGQNLSYHLELHDETEDGLYLVKSSYEAQKPAVNVTFTLKNHLLNQNLQRPVLLSYDKDTTANQGTIALVLSSVCFFLVIAIIWFVRRRNKRKPLAVNHVN